MRTNLTYTHPEALLGAVHPVCTGPLTAGLGFTNHGGTFDTGGTLLVKGGARPAGLAQGVLI